MATKKKSNASKPVKVGKPKGAWNPSEGENAGCPVCGVIPSNDFPGYDPKRPAAYQAMVFHMHGAPAQPPSLQFPKGVEAIEGAHPDDDLPDDPDAE